MLLGDVRLAPARPPAAPALAVQLRERHLITTTARAQRRVLADVRPALAVQLRQHHLTATTAAKRAIAAASALALVDVL